MNQVEEHDGRRSQVEVRCIALFEMRQVRNARKRCVDPGLLNPVRLDVDAERPRTSGSRCGDRKPAIAAPEVVYKIARRRAGDPNHAFDDFRRRRDIGREDERAYGHGEKGSRS